MKRAVDYLITVQEKDGSWFGRWGMNYIYGTWSVLCAFNVAKVDPCSDSVSRAVAFLVGNQNADGGWGEGAETYERQYDGYQQAQSTASQTAWALIALMAAGQVDHPAVEGGVQYLKATQGPDGLWQEARFNRHRVPESVLPALPRILEVLPAVGAGPLPQHEDQQPPPGPGRDVTGPARHRRVGR